MTKEKSKRALILEAHEADCNTPAWRIAIIVGCTEDYVHSCLSQTGRRVGSPFCDKGGEGHQKHFLIEPFKPNVSRNEVCQRKWLERGQLVQCYFPTEAGATYCPDCAMHLITYLDRKPPPVTSIDPAKRHPWSNTVRPAKRQAA